MPVVGPRRRASRLPSLETLFFHCRRIRKSFLHGTNADNAHSIASLTLEANEAAGSKPQVSYPAVYCNSFDRCEYRITDMPSFSACWTGRTETVAGMERPCSHLGRRDPNPSSDPAAVSWRDIVHEMSGFDARALGQA